MHYLLLVNVYLTIFYGFYWVFLKNETFFKLNRWYFLGSTGLSFGLPLVELGAVFSQPFTELLGGEDLAMFFLPAVNVTNEPTGGMSVLFTVYLVGCIVLLASFLYRIMRVKKKLLSPASGDAYSFFKLIRVDPQLDGYEKIVSHEQIHVKQLHSWDILLFELVKIINWFNPLVYLLMRSVKLTHEYIADEQFVRAEHERLDYANLLVSRAFNTPNMVLGNNFFNQSFLKNRIVMLFKTKSKKSVLARFSLLIPIVWMAVACQSETTDPQRGSLDEVVLSAPSATDTVVSFEAVNVQPEPPGGMRAFLDYIGQNYTYPQAAVDAGVEGRVVLTFVVDDKGNITNVQSVRDLGYGTAEEAIRVLEASSPWKPGRVKDKAVRVRYTLPITLKKTTAASIPPPPPVEPG